MKKNLDAAMRRKEKWENKQKKQAKVLTVLGIIALAAVLVITLLWALYSMDLWKNREYTEAEKKALFEDTKALPEEDDPLVGTWFFFESDGSKIHSKYVFTKDGFLEVYFLDNSSKEQESYVLGSLAEYRVRPDASELYVWAKDDENSKDKGSVVTYTYNVEKKGSAYLFTWKHGADTWNMIRPE